MAMAAHLRDEIDVSIGLFAIEQRNDALVTQCRELFKFCDFFVQRVLVIGQTLL
jgi:hypothetical protein